KLPLHDGVRGAVALAAGTFTLAGSLTINASGVVLRGAGAKSTILQITGNPRRILQLRGSGSVVASGKTAVITDAYVPAGARSFHVDDASGLGAGTPVLVSRPVTQAWVHFMGMDTLVRNGQPQTWIKVGTLIRPERPFTAVVGNEVTVDIPVADSFDAQYVATPGASVQPYSFPGRIANVGIEGLHVIAPGMATPINQATFELMSIDAVVD